MTITQLVTIINFYIQLGLILKCSLFYNDDSIANSSNGKYYDHAQVKTIFLSLIDFEKYFMGILIYNCNKYNCMWTAIILFSIKIRFIRVFW